METKKVFYKIIVIVALYFLSFFVEKATASLRASKKNSIEQKKYH